MTGAPHLRVNGDPELFGYRLLGPYLVSFCRWMHERKMAMGPDALLLFTARDAYIPLKVYRILYPEDEACAYLLASRISAALMQIETPDDFLRFIAKGSSRHEILNRLFGEEAALDSSNVLAASARCRHRYVRYLQDLIGERFPIVVDIGYKASTQTLLADLLGRSVAGLYLVTHASARSVVHSAGPIDAFDANFIPAYSNVGFVNRHRHIVEAVLAEPKGTFLGFGNGGAPHFAHADGVRESESLTASIVQGVERFAHEVRKAPGAFMANTSAMLGHFFDAPHPADAAVFSALTFDDGLQGRTYYLVVPADKRSNSYALWVSGQRAIDRAAAIRVPAWERLLYAIEDVLMRAGLGGVGYACYATNRSRFIAENGGLLRLYRRAMRGFRMRYMAFLSARTDSHPSE